MSLTFGLIVGNRDFFPGELARAGREEMIGVLEKKGFQVICPSPEDTTLGTVETWDDAKKCAALFRENADKIDGIVVTLPNFGDEKGVANTIRLSGLDVPILVHAYPDDPDALDIANRRDSFCGKISVCNNLIQYGIPFSLTRLHTVSPRDASFDEDLNWFAGVCRVVKGFKNLKLGAIGARPSAFNTVRFSEKILEAYGISVETIDLSEIFGAMGKLSSEDQAVKTKIEELRSYCDVGAIPEAKLTTMARFAVVVEQWMKENDLSASAIQCWTSMEYNLGIAPCAVMSMMGEKLIPSACEVDVTGALAMYALSLASQTPSGIADWNNNYGKDPDKAVIFHCGNFPRSLFENVEMGYLDIVGTTVGKENAYGSCVGRIKSGPLTYARFTTDDLNGTLKAYVGEGEITEDELKTFGARGVVQVSRLQELLQFICRNGFEHHVAFNHSQVADIFHEAVSNYLGIEAYWHK